MVDFSFSSQKVWNLDVSISSRIMRFVCKISLSLLETRENIFGFLFSSRNWRKCLKFLHFFGKNSRSLLEPENRSRHFSFLFSKLEMWIPYFSFSSRFDFLPSRQCLIMCYDIKEEHTHKHKHSLFFFFQWCSIQPLPFWSWEAKPGTRTTSQSKRPGIEKTTNQWIEFEKVYKNIFRRNWTWDFIGTKMICWYS